MPRISPDEAIVARETIELAFLVAIQQLPPRQRAVLILRDVVGWSARETAAMLEVSVIAANSALQRARETLRLHLPERRDDWRARPTDPHEGAVLARYMDAWKHTDVHALAALLKEDARADDAAVAGVVLRPRRRRALLRHVSVPPRRAPAPARADACEQAAGVRRLPEGPAGPEPFALEVLRIEDGLIAELHYFLQPELLELFAIAPPA